MDDSEEALDSTSYESLPKAPADLPGWIKVGAIAAASVLAGGLAAVWFYRKTLTQAHQDAKEPQNTKFGSKIQSIEDES